MRIIFCNIGWMKYYKGITKNDRLVHEGSWAEVNEDRSESENFLIANDGHCYGYISTEVKHGKGNQLYIERLEGVWESDEQAENVLVIWGAKEDRPDGKNVIIGWYKNATVLRNYKYNMDEVPYNFFAFSQDCVLLPINQRHKIVARTGSGGYPYGMGRCNVWFAQEKAAQVYVQNIVKFINEYLGDNWINK
jgi:hypothetical protein